MEQNAKVITYIDISASLCVYTLNSQCHKVNMGALPKYRAKNASAANAGSRLS
jgi:hypothetical protein